MPSISLVSPPLPRLRKDGNGTCVTYSQYTAEDLFEPTIAFYYPSTQPNDSPPRNIPTAIHPSPDVHGQELSGLQLLDIHRALDGHGQIPVGAILTRIRTM